MKKSILLLAASIICNLSLQASPSNNGLKSKYINSDTDLYTYYNNKPSFVSLNEQFMAVATGKIIYKIDKNNFIVADSLVVDEANNYKGGLLKIGDDGMLYAVYSSRDCFGAVENNLPLPTILLGTGDNYVIKMNNKSADSILALSYYGGQCFIKIDPSTFEVLDGVFFRGTDEEGIIKDFAVRGGKVVFIRQDLVAYDVFAYPDGILTTDNAYMKNRNFSNNTYISCFDFANRKLLAGTYLGGNGTECPNNLLFDDQGNIIFSQTISISEVIGGGVMDYDLPKDYPVTNNAFRITCPEYSFDPSQAVQPPMDYFAPISVVSKLTPDLSTLLYSSYIWKGDISSLELLDNGGLRIFGTAVNDKYFSIEGDNEFVFCSLDLSDDWSSQVDYNIFVQKTFSSVSLINQFYPRVISLPNNRYMIYNSSSQNWLTPTANAFQIEQNQQGKRDLGFAVFDNNTKEFGFQGYLGSKTSDYSDDIFYDADSDRIFALTHLTGSDNSELNFPVTDIESMPPSGNSVNCVLMRFDYVGCLAKADEEAQNKNFAYPNPANNVLNLIGIEGNSKTEILDYLGNCVLSSYSSQIDISSLPIGFYVIKNGNIT